MSNIHTCLKTIVVSALLLLASACGGGQSGPADLSAPAGVDSQLSADTQLVEALRSELQRLGRDISATTPLAPSGSANAVFDLKARLGSHSASAVGGSSGVELAWTEQLAGDYDQNGMVGLSDLTPLSQHLRQSVDYASAALPGGFPARPAGSPEDPPSGPAPAANNWRLARIDGDSNGEINVSDVTAIAQHWGETLSGYQVYRRAPGESSFSPLGSEAVSVQRPAVSAGSPVGYSFTDGGSLSDGNYEYYVAPVYSGSGLTGQPSPVLVVNPVQGTQNLAPVSVVDASPRQASAGLPLSFDASASFDFDGSISELRWDLEGDGTVDYSTAGAPLSPSSSGAVDGITPGPAAAGGIPLTLTASYNSGSSEYYHARVQAVDDQGAAGNWGEVLIGISAWERQLVSSNGDDSGISGTELAFDITDMKFDPASGDLLALGLNPGPEHLVGSGLNPQLDGGSVYDASAPSGAYLARRGPGGAWSVELVASPATGVIADYGYFPRIAYLGWQDNGQPLALLSAYKNGFSMEGARSFIARRQADGSWLTSNLLGAAQNQDCWLKGVTLQAPEKFVAHILVSTGGISFKDQVLSYDHGSIRLEDTGGYYLDPETWFGVNDNINVGPDGTYYLPSYSLDRRDIPSYLERSSSGEYVLRSLSAPDMPGDTQKIDALGFANGKNYVAAMAIRKYEGISYYLLEEQAGEYRTVWSQLQALHMSNSPLVSFQDCAISLVDSVADVAAEDGNKTDITVHRYEDGQSHDELAYQLAADSSETARCGQLADDPQGQLAFVLRPKGGPYGYSLNQFVLSRIGPVSQ